LQFHEQIDRGRAVRGGSDRQFGIVFAVVFSAVGFSPLLGENGTPRMWALAVSAGFAVVAFAAPHFLKYMNAGWTRLGQILSIFVQPILLGAIFFFVVTPLALAMRLTGRDALRLQLSPEVRTYWIEREPAGPDPRSMPDQF